MGRPLEGRGVEPHPYRPGFIAQTILLKSMSRGRGSHTCSSSVRFTCTWNLFSRPAPTARRKSSVKVIDHPRGEQVARISDARSSRTRHSRSPLRDPATPNREGELVAKRAAAHWRNAVLVEQT